jgi:hypothetical protein
MAAERWAAVEIMGHRQHVGRIAEESFAGATMLRVESLNPDGTFEVIHYGGASIFSVREITERAARTAVARKSWAACLKFTEPSAVPGLCALCGHTAEEHEAAAMRRALPTHGDDDYDDDAPCLTDIVDEVDAHG